MNQTAKSIVVIDNYDSFTYNLVHLIEQFDISYKVFRNDEVDWYYLDEASHILLGPGPGLPSEAGALNEIIMRYKSIKSILGVCLGMQALLEIDGMNMVNMPTVQHGMADQIKIIKQQGIFDGLPNQVTVGRYHSWAFEPNQPMGNYAVTALGSDGFIMAVQHMALPLFGVQFHPESIMTSHGKEMLENWIFGDIYTEKI